ncbi:MAG: hypothetical protein ABGZ17_24825 [Planctomycetaceae bacterium]
MKRSADICTIGLSLAMTAVLAGCRGGSDPSAVSTDASDKQDVARSRVERGPLVVTVAVEPKTARLSDEPTLTVTIEAHKDVQVNRPPFGAALGEFLIRDFRETVPKVDGDRQIMQQIYTLEPTRVGQLSIAPIAVTFQDTRRTGDGQQHSVETEALTVEVTTAVGDEIPTLSDLRPATGPVELPEPAGGSLGWLFGAGLLLVGLLLGWRRWRRPTRNQAPQLSAFELAYLELDGLLEGNLSETDVKRFYVELTAIVRRYLERTTGVRAPEQTTEEFLREISGFATFTSDERERLQQFLESADLVKFAAQRPDKQDIEQSFERAKAFIGIQPQAASEDAA